MIGSVNEKLVGVGRVLGVPTADISRPVRTAVSAIDRVHNVPELAHPVPVVSDAAMVEAGKYRWDKATGRPVDIRLNPQSDHLELTTVLEIGHLLDHQAIGLAGEFASESHPFLAEWRKAIDSTRAVQKLEDLRAAGSIPLKFPDGIVRQFPVGRKASDLLELPELFSRSYAQCIAESSDSSRLVQQIHGFRRPENPSSVVPYYWADDDFGDVSKAFESLIIKLGWK
jgi:hypothetical protein